MALICIRKYPLSTLSTIVIGILSLAPIGAPEMAQDVPFFDKWAHFVMYGGLALVISLENHRWGKDSLVSRMVCLCYSIALGGLMELAQAYLTTYRSGEWMDFAADSVGALLGCGGAMLCLTLAMALRNHDDSKTVENRGS